MNHLLLCDSELNGWEYGMLRSFEKAIVQNTGAAIASIPSYNHPLAKKYLSSFGHGMSKGKYRRYFPKQKLSLQADVAWYILMGPENYRLDLFTDWAQGCKTKILYLYDTLPGQYPLIKKLFSNGQWDLLITSFNDAADDLQKITGRKWHVIEQAADDMIFQPIPIEQRNIHFSAYGRRYQPFHAVLKEFCEANGLYYDYTTHDGKHPTAGSDELYKQYAWHINHSLFTVSWPVEFTNASRAGHLHPITCRWFEAAAAGTIIIGKKPGNGTFDKVLNPELVCEIDPFQKKEEIWKSLDRLYANKSELFAKAQQINKQNLGRWTWNERVNNILALLNT